MINKINKPLAQERKNESHAHITYNPASTGMIQVKGNTLCRKET